MVVCCNRGIDDRPRLRGLPLPRLPRVPSLAAVGDVSAGRIVDLPGRGSTYVIDSGPQEGPTYVLLHSLACTGLMTWYPALDVIRCFGRVVVFDQRWHGQGISSPSSCSKTAPTTLSRWPTRWELKPSCRLATRWDHWSPS